MQWPFKMESPSQEQEIINSGQLTPGFSWSSDIISQCKMWVCWFCCNVCRKWGRYVPFLLNIANKEGHCQKTNWRGLCLTACMQPAYVTSSIWLVSCHHTTLPSSKSLQWREDGWASWQWRRHVHSKVQTEPGNTRWNSCFESVQYHAEHVHLYKELFLTENSSAQAVKNNLELIETDDKQKALQMKLTFNS